MWRPATIVAFIGSMITIVIVANFLSHPNDPEQWRERYNVVKERAEEASDFARDERKSMTIILSHIPSEDLRTAWKEIGRGKLEDRASDLIYEELKLRHESTGAIKQDGKVYLMVPYPTPIGQNPP